MGFIAAPQVYFETFREKLPLAVRTRIPRLLVIALICPFVVEKQIVRFNFATQKVFEVLWRLGEALTLLGRTLALVGLPLLFAGFKVDFENCGAIFSSTKRVNPYCKIPYIAE
jgi:hypothetical protein